MSDRIQREVDELLRKLDVLPPKRPLSWRIKRVLGAPFRAIGSLLAGVSLPHVSAGHILLAAIIIIVVAYVAGGSGGLWNWIIAAGILLFIAAFVMSLRRQGPGASGGQKYWRDRPLDLRRGGDQRSWWDRWRGRR